MCLYIISLSVIGIVVAAVLAVLISAVILWVIRKKELVSLQSLQALQQTRISKYLS